MFTQKEPNNANKSRTPSRCREWERQRRLKFNDAITKLGNLIRSIDKENGDSTNEKQGATQFPKIEIIQKAILCLTNFTEEKSKLKAEVLALEVKLQGIEQQKCNTKDVCVQVAVGAVKGKQSSKYLKLLMLKKSKNKGPQVNKSDKPQTRESDTSKARKPLSQLPKLLPLPNNVKKENTIVMLPATPYLFPQRPILFPAATPTLVLLDTNLQSLNKQPIVNRNISDMTKTTMVNVLPISAYSHPLSANRTRKNPAKQKNMSKKGSKKNRDELVTPKTLAVSEKDSSSVQRTEICEAKSQTNLTCVSEKGSESTEKVIDVNMSEKSISNSKDNHVGENNKKPLEALSTKKPLEPDINENVKEKNAPKASDVENKTISNKSSDIGSESVILNKPLELKEPEKTKDKLQNVLEPICENAVDAGNARLELAEEFLAASPTAAFLMSFPLVSGNRADSPSEEAPQNNNLKENICRAETQPQTFFEKPNNLNQKPKLASKPQNVNDPIKNNSTPAKNSNKTFNKPNDIKIPSSTSIISSVCNDNPFLNLPLPTVISTNCTLPDTSFGLDFDCSISKTTSGQVTNFASSNSLFYKSDPFNSVKNTVYSTSNLSSGHEYNSLGLYPCAVENYSSKNKSDFPNIDENLMKINTSRLTYDIDLGWSHKSLDFVNCTTASNSLHKDNIFTSTASTYSSAYNPFNPEFHASLTNATKKDLLTTKSSTFSEAITSFYSQTNNLWADDVTSIFANGTAAAAAKTTSTKNQHFIEPNQGNTNLKSNITKQYDSKHMIVPMENNIKTQTAIIGNQHSMLPEKYTKKSPSKMHINWMTSETRTSQNTCEQIQPEVKENYKSNYGHINMASRKMVQGENNYFPINMHHIPSQNSHEEIQIWPSTKPAGTAEISIEPPPIHLPTLVGDLALGPHEKKRNDLIQRGLYQSEQNCSNFFSVTQLMNRTSENARLPNIENKPNTKHNLSHIVNDGNRKSMNARIDTLQNCYGFIDTKVTNNFEAVNQFSHTKSKTIKPEKNPKQHKNNYSAEALIRGGTCSQKALDNSNTKFILPSQKFGDFNITHDTSVAQVSHYPPLLDYSENSYVGQQYSGTTLYNSTANTMPNSFYSNFMQTGSNLMPSSYTGGPFTGEFMDYNSQSTECNYSNHKFDDKSRNTTHFQHEKSSRREAAKHKLDCNKKESNKKYPTKRTKMNTESEEWGEHHNLLWQNKTTSKRHSNNNVMPEELQFPNFVSNQMPSQYQPEFLNSHLMPTNIQNSQSTDRTASTFPASSRGNFNLSALFPEITMKVQ